MNCENEGCHSEAAVRLSQNMARQTWLCPYCAARTLSAVNPKSFRTLREEPLIKYKEPPTR